MNKRYRSLFFFVVFICVLISTSFLVCAKSIESLKSSKNYTSITAKSNKLKSGVYVVKKNLTINKNRSNLNGLCINNNSKVVIYINKGCTLKVYGKNGTGKKSDSNYKRSGAGIYLPSSSSLTILGEGKLFVYGGHANKDVGASAAIGTNGAYYKKVKQNKKCKYTIVNPTKSSDKVFISSNLTVYTYGGLYNSKYKSCSIGEGSKIAQKKYKGISTLFIWDIDNIKEAKVYSKSHQNKDNTYNYKYVNSISDMVKKGAYNIEKITLINTPNKNTGPAFNCPSFYEEDEKVATSSVFAQGNNTRITLLFIITLVVMIAVLIRNKKNVEI